MIEHRLIERIVKLLKHEFSCLEKSQEPDLILLEGAVDFYHIYADMCHHGKEEDILFRQLLKKKLSGEHRRLLEVLSRITSRVVNSSRDCPLPAVIAGMAMSLPS